MVFVLYISLSSSKKYVKCRLQTISIAAHILGYLLQDEFNFMKCKIKIKFKSQIEFIKFKQ